jgi:hypothetical protein
MDVEDVGVIASVGSAREMDLAFGNLGFESYTDGG